MIAFVIILITSLVVLLASIGKKRGAPQESEQQRQTDELITVILPTIKD